MNNDVNLRTVNAGLRDRLKAITAEDHRITEQVMHSDKIMSGELSLDQYKHLLRTHFVFHSALEKAITEKVREFAAMRPTERRKAHLFRNDLLQLKEPLPKEEDLFDGWEFGRLLGACYVAEGSTLGGAVIARALKKNASLDPATSSVTSFGAYGEKTGQQWKDFLVFLEEHAPTESEAACVGANKAFQLLRDVFDRMKMS